MIVKSLTTFLLVLGVCLSSNRLNSEEYPNRPIQVVVPTTPGGTFDKIARLIQRDFEANQRLSEKLVVQNVPGAGGVFGTTRIKDAIPDGYTIGLWNPGLVTSKLMGNADFDHTAFDILGATGFINLGLGVRDDSPYSSIEELLLHLRSEPESIKAATNLGLPVHFFPLLFAEAAEVEFRFVQAGGGAKRLASILGGHTDISQFSTLEFENYASSDSDRIGIRPLVLFTEERSPKFPHTPTARELGYDIALAESAFWLAPKGMPKSQLELLRNALRGAMGDPDLIREFEAMGMKAEFVEASEVISFLDGVRQRCELIPYDRLQVSDVVPINFPAILFSVTVICFLLLIAKSLKQRRSSNQKSRRASVRTWAFLVITGLYIGILPVLGYLYATILCVALSGFALSGFRVKKQDIVGVSLLALTLGVGVNALFVTVFKINLP